MSKTPVLCIPHGGGPLPLMGHEKHTNLIKFLNELPKSLDKPNAIVLISAHWEEDAVSITSGKQPTLIYDYYGFPEETYSINYPSPGDPALANTIAQLLGKANIPHKLDKDRGFDHGMFVPLKLMYPQAEIPVVQLSLNNNLNAQAHITIGKAISSLRDQGVLIIGSGFTFHNMKVFGQSNDEKNEAFEDWLVNVCIDKKLSEIEREKALIGWEKAPYARYCHPREEHLLPLLVCYGAAQSPASLMFYDIVLDKRTSGYRWA